MSDKLSDENVIPLARRAPSVFYTIAIEHGPDGVRSIKIHDVEESDENQRRVAAALHEAADMLAASPAPAIPAEPVPPFGWVQPNGGNYFTRSEVAAKRIGGLMPVYASPPASIAPAISESEDAKRLDFIAAESVDLVSFAIQYEDDADIGWRVLQQHIGEAEPRVIGEVFEDDPRAAIDAARKGEKS
ncbi:hypothetical protein [Burkholderia glumae]|uniref:hypothetical protein n=1 Tax=Burkholderia glumae TaxID=337 RepID=UPI00214FB71F|nr:hypothetical protein [Burkholderia glumae]